MHGGAKRKKHGWGVNHRERLSLCQTCSQGIDFELAGRETAWAVTSV